MCACAIQTSCAKPSLGATLNTSYDFCYGVLAALAFDVAFLLAVDDLNLGGLTGVVYAVAVAVFTFVVSYSKLPPLPSKVSANTHSRPAWSRPQFIRVKWNVAVVDV